jgi:hypothetical protein
VSGVQGEESRRQRGSWRAPATDRGVAIDDVQLYAGRRQFRSECVCAARDRFELETDHRRDRHRVENAPCDDLAERGLECRTGHLVDA